MSRYVDVLPDPGRALSQLFTYLVPEELRSAIRPGAQVLVPFGSRSVIGVVAGWRESSEREGLKEVEAVLEEAPVLGEDALPLARWISDWYVCELGEALRAFLPQGMSYRIGRRFQLAGRPIPEDLRARADLGRVLRHVESADGEVSLAALRRLLPAPQLSRALRLLKSRGLISERAFLLRPQTRARHVNALAPAVSEEEINRYCETRARSAPARVAALRAAAAKPGLAPGKLAAEAGVSLAAVRALVQEGLLARSRTAVRRVPWREVRAEQTAPLALTTEQAAAVKRIAAAAQARRSDTFLLHGVTASGKTEVFLRVLDGVLREGRQAIVLMPEISLTAQALAIYRARFGDRVAIVHSGLAPGERRDEWQRVQEGDASVVIGARSAVFAPVRDLGLIVVDEEHETSFKQDHAPRYHAREVAAKRAQWHHCPLVLASATPSLESFHAAEQGRYQLLRLPSRVEDRPLPKVRVVDRRASSSGRSILSPPLRQAIGQRLAAGEQVILFLNRRGFATFLLCPQCGQSMRCPNCQVALTYHQSAEQVQCHHCGLAERAFEVCSRCGGHQIRFSGFGTERVENELRRVFPHARIGRMDRDTTARRGSHVSIVGQFRAVETNVLVGTQMVAKGFDFPGVTLVGVISADTSLNLPDFRAAERTFQLLTQVAGRSGRGEKEGEVIIQTYRPEDYSIEAAARQDYEGFYQHEIATRAELNYPPFSQLTNVVVTAAEEEKAIAQCQRLSDELRARVAEAGLELLGPAPAPMTKLRGRYRWHLLLRGPHGAAQPILRDALAGFGESPAASITVDVDPTSLM